MSSRPSKRQIKFLVRRGVLPPPIKKCCRQLINFIKTENSAPDRTESKNIEVLLKYQQRYIGKRVRLNSAFVDKRGTVRYLTARKKSGTTESQRQNHHDYPLYAIVDWDDEPGKIIPISALRLDD